MANIQMIIMYYDYVKMIQKYTLRDLSVNRNSRFDCCGDIDFAITNELSFPKSWVKLKELNINESSHLFNRGRAVSELMS